MITKALTYRSIKLFALISTFLLILSSCDIVDAIFGSGDDDIINTSDQGYNLIGTQVIGSTGGKINLDSIIVNVPSGAFDENTEISIYVGEENDGFDEYGISSLYQIKGLPSTINKPVRISIKYYGTLEGDTLIAIGKMHHATSLDSILYSYNAENASDSSGYLVYDLPVYSSLAKLALPEDVKSTYLKMVALGFYKKMLSSKGNFILSYPIMVSTEAVLMGEHFEKAFQTCEDMGFDLSARSWSNYPANVLAKPFSKADKNTSGWYSLYWFGDDFIDVVDVTKMVNDAILRFYINTGNFTINLNILSDDLKLRTVCGHEFLHLVQHLYEFYTDITPEQAWLEEATAVWIEEKYANVSNYFSSTLNNREIYPFLGWQFIHKGEDDYAEQGYGLSPIIKEIADFQGERSIVDIFEKIKAGTLPSNAVDPVDAVISVLWDPVEPFWHGVLSSYVLGEYYNSQVNFKFLNDQYSYTDLVTIDAQNSEHKLKEEYHDLSGKLFLVDHGDLSTLTTVPLSITVDDPNNCGILVCKFKPGSEITRLGEVFPGKSGIVTLSDVKPVFDAGYVLLVMVSNSSHDKSKNYQGTNEVELTIDLATEILNGSVRFGLDKVVTNRNDSGSLEEVLHFNGLNGNFSNNRYNGSYNYESLGRTYSGTVEITFIDNPESINFHLNGQYTYQSLWGFGTVTFRYTVNYDGIPYKGLEGEYVKYHVYSESGSTVQKINVTWSETNSQYTENLISWDCGDGAYIRVEVDKRE